jgi:hypothetical protein
VKEKHLQFAVTFTGITRRTAMKRFILLLALVASIALAQTPVHAQDDSTESMESSKPAKKISAKKKAKAKTPDQASKDEPTSSLDNSMGDSSQEKKSQKKTEKIIQSVFFWLPNPGHLAIEAGYLNVSGKTKMTTLFGDADVNYTNSNISTRLIYSYNANVSVDVAWSPAQTSTSTASIGGFTTESKSSGYEDPTLNGYYRIPGKTWSFFSSIGATIPMGQAKEANATDKKDGNSLSGGISIPVRLGATIHLNEQNHLGAEVGYTHNLERKIDTQSTDGTKTVEGGHGNSVRAFYEFDLGSIFVISSAGYVTSASTKSTTNSGSTNSNGSKTTLYRLEIGYGANSDFLVSGAYQSASTTQPNPSGGADFTLPISGFELLVRYQF